MRRIPTFLIVIVILAFCSVFMSGCAMFKAAPKIEMTQDVQEGLAGITTSTCGYFIGESEPGLIEPAQKWALKAVNFLEGTSEVTDLDVNGLLKEGFNLAVNKPFYRLQFGNFLKLVKIDLNLEISEPSFLTEERKRCILSGIQGLYDGLEAAKLANL